MLLIVSDGDDSTKGCKSLFENLGSEENNFSECLAPNQFELIDSLKPREARFFFSAAKFGKRYINIASERAFPGFFGDIFGCSTPSKKRCLSTQEFTRFLSTV